MMVSVLTMMMWGCGNATQDGETSSDSQTEEVVASVDCLEVLSTVWGAMDESQRFAAAGGDFSPENQKMDEPGNFGLEDAESVDNMLGFPAGEISKVDKAASLMHMMNANTFTCGAFHVVDGSQADALADTVKDNICKRQWMCGCPDKYVIGVTGGNLIVMFGDEELINDFKGKLESSYSDTRIIYDEPIPQQ